MSIALIICAALLLDWVLGEPRRFHPLVGFGRIATAVEKRLYQPGKWRGLLAALLLLLPFAVIAALLQPLPLVGEAVSLLTLWFAIGHRSLHDHVRPIAEALRRGDEEAARGLAGRIVSRDTDQLDVAAAATESVLENGNDAVFGALFWFALAGAPGVVCYRLANTLDAMWGYRNERYLQFGWAAARLDDLLNYLPARLTALTYALLGASGRAFTCWRAQAAAWESPNAGPVMAAGAGALQISLGGPARYHGAWRDRPLLGEGRRVDADDPERALRLVRNGVILWAVLLAGGFALA